MGIISPREPSSPRQPIAQPKQPIAKPRPSAPKSPPRKTVTESIPVDSVPAYSRPSVPDQPIAPAVQPIRPVPTSAPQSIPQTPAITPIDTDSQNFDPVPDSGVRGTGINPDYDNSDEEGYNYKVPKNQLSLPKKRKKSSRQPPPSSDERLDAEAPLPIYGAPPEPFDGGSSHISNDILTPPAEEEEDVLPGYLPPDSRQGRQGRKGRRLSSGGRRGRRFNTFNRRRGRFIYL